MGLIATQDRLRLVVLGSNPALCGGGHLPQFSLLSNGILKAVCGPGHIPQKVPLGPEPSIVEGAPTRQEGEDIDWLCRAADPLTSELSHLPSLTPCSLGRPVPGFCLV